MALPSKASSNSAPKAILRASDKSGSIVLCDRAGGNAFIILYQGRPAVITAAHLATRNHTNEMKCSEQEMQNASYYPNLGYYNSDSPDDNKDFYLQRVDLEYPPINLEEAVASFVDPDNFDDYMIFFLTEDLTHDIMPGGHQRSYYKLPKNIPHRGDNLIAIGMMLDPNRNNHSLLYHAGCNFTRTDNGMRINHDCNSVSGVSGSVLGILENDEIVFAGLVHGSRLEEAVIGGPSRYLEPGWNYGVSSSVVFGE
jgi:hypothetical protein